MIKTKYLPVLIILGIISFFSIILSVYTVDAGYSAVVLRNGAISTTNGEGLHFKVPFIDRVVYFETRTIKSEANADAASRDLQQLTLSIAINHRIEREKVGEVYKQFGVDYEQRIISPRLQESIKIVTARFSAEEIITKRSEVRQQISDEMRSKLENSNIILEDLSIVNLEYSPQFSQAIEEKQLAEQRALKAQNDLERVEIEAQQKIISAQATAEEQRLQQQTLNELLIQKQFIEKWNGELPQIYGLESGILDVGALTKNEAAQ